MKAGFSGNRTTLEKGWRREFFRPLPAQGSEMDELEIILEKHKKRR